MTQITQFLILHGGLFLFVIVFADQSGLPFPAVPWLVAAGALAAGGKLNLMAVICWAAIGSLAADAMWFYIGQRGRSRIFRAFPDLQALPPGVRYRISTRLILRGIRVLTVAKFIPFGSVVPLRAGALSRPVVLFLVVDALSSVAYAGVYVLAGLLFHNQLEQAVSIIRKLGVLAFLLLLLGLGVYLRHVIVKRRRIRQTSAKTAAETKTQLQPQPPGFCSTERIGAPELPTHPLSSDGSLESNPTLKAASEEEKATRTTNDVPQRDGPIVVITE